MKRSNPAQTFLFCFVCMHSAKLQCKRETFTSQNTCAIRCTHKHSIIILKEINGCFLYFCSFDREMCEVEDSRRFLAFIRPFQNQSIRIGINYNTHSTLMMTMHSSGFHFKMKSINFIKNQSKFWCEIIYKRHFFWPMIYSLAEYLI